MADVPKDWAGKRMDRRDFLRSTALLGVGAAAGALGAFAWSAAVAPDAPARPLPLQWPGQARLVRPSDLDGPTPAFLAAQFKLRPALVVKLSLDTLRAAAEARGYNTGQFGVMHPDEPGSVLLAYDAKCTHMGCTVGWNAELGGSADVPDYDGDGTPDGRLLCPCHMSQFDVHDLGANLPGMPAQRPLDAIPLRLGEDEQGPVLVGMRRIVQKSLRDADGDGPGAPFHVPASLAPVPF